MRAVTTATYANSGTSIAHHHRRERRSRLEAASLIAVATASSKNCLLR